MPKCLTNKRGIAFVWVLIAMLVLPILTIAVLNVAVAENKFAARQEDKLQAYYIARSGALAIAEHMLLDHGGATGLVGKMSDWNNQIGGGRFMVTISEDANRVVDVVSVGEHSGVQQTARIRLTRSEGGIGGVFQHAIAARNNISVANVAGTGINITGSVATRNGSIDLGLHGSVTRRVIDPNMIFPPIVAPPNRNPPILYNFTYEKIDTDQTIPAAGTPIYVRVGSIDLKNETITIASNRIVHMYVFGNINMETDSRFDVPPTSRLYIYVVGERTIKLSGNGSQNNVFLYAPDSNIEWNNAQPNNDFFGSIIGNSVTLHNKLTIRHNSDMVNDVEIGRASCRERV